MPESIGHVSTVNLALVEFKHSQRILQIVFTAELLDLFQQMNP